MSKHYAAYQVWQRPSYMSGPKFSRRYYGCGDSPEAAVFHATHYTRDGQVWAYGSGSGHPNACDLSVATVRGGCPCCDREIND